MRTFRILFQKKEGKQTQNLTSKVTIFKQRININKPKKKNTTLNSEKWIKMKKSVRIRLQWRHAVQWRGKGVSRAHEYFRKNWSFLSRSESNFGNFGADSVQGGFEKCKEWVESPQKWMNRAFRVDPRVPVSSFVCRIVSSMAVFSANRKRLTRMSLADRLRGEEEIGVLLDLRRRVAVRVSIHVVCGLRHFRDRAGRLSSLSRPELWEPLRTLHKCLGTGSPERVYDVRTVYCSSVEKSRGDDFYELALSQSRHTT